MTIIQPGNVTIKAIKKYRLNCQRCGCLFECEESEIKKHDDYRNGIYVSCVCPTCGAEAHGAQIQYRGI